MAWLSGWKYRRKLTIRGSSAGSQTNYQIPINLWYGTGSNTPPHLYFNGKCQDNFKDIRFTTDDGVTLLDHWKWSNYVWNLTLSGSFIAKGSSGWDSGQLRQLGGLIDDNGRFHFWYGGYQTVWQIGYAYSDNMTSSVKGSYNPIIPYNAYGTSQEVRDPTIAKKGNTYYIYVQANTSGQPNRIGLSKTDNPAGSSITHVGYVLQTGTSGSFDDYWCASPAVVQDDFSTVTLFYEALKASPTQYRIGMATSSDGESFTKHGAIKDIAGNDFVNPYGISNAIVPITVVRVNGIYYMFLHYYTGSVWRAGILKSTNLVNWEWSQDAITANDATSPFAIVKDGVWRIYTEETGKANLNLWNNTAQVNSDATAWVKIPSIPENPNTVDIYVYYGNEEASDNANILDTFINGDDGNEGNFTESVSGTGAISHANKKYYFVEDTTDDAVLAGCILDDWKFLAQICEWQKVVSFSGQILFGLFDSDTVANLRGTQSVAGPKRRFFCSRVPGTFGGADTFYIQYQNPGGTFYYWNGTGWQTSSVGFSVTSRVNVEIRIWSDETIFFMDILRGGVSIMANPASIEISSVKGFTSGKCLAFGDLYTDAWWFRGWIDDYFVKKYVSPEPTWTSWSSEESFGYPRICVNEAWKDVSEMKICLGQQWKDVSEVKICIGNTWKNLTT